MPLPLWLCSGSHAAVPAHAVTTLQEKLREKQRGWAPGSDHIRSAKERSTHHKPSQPEHPGEGGISSSLALLPLDTGQGTVTAPLSLREAASAPSQSPEPAQGGEAEFGPAWTQWENLAAPPQCGMFAATRGELRSPEEKGKSRSRTPYVPGKTNFPITLPLCKADPCETWGKQRINQGALQPCTRRAGVESAALSTSHNHDSKRASKNGSCGKRRQG